MSRAYGSSALASRERWRLDRRRRVGRPGTRIRSVLDMSEIDERLMDLVKRRSTLPASIAVMETHTHAQRINACLADLESNTMRLAACWDGELDPIGAFSQLSYLHEKVGRAEAAARSLRKEIDKISGWDQPAPRE